MSRLLRNYQLFTLPSNKYDKRWSKPELAAAVDNILIIRVAIKSRYKGAN